MKRRGLSKSRIVSYRQCPKRLWLEIHRPDLLVIDEALEQRFESGHEVGDLARGLEGAGTLIGHQDDLRRALSDTRAALDRGGKQLLFEAALEHDGILVRADILELRGRAANVREVKATGSVKDYHLTDAAVQSWVLQKAGLKVESIQIQHIDTSFIYAGAGKYKGIFKTKSVDAEIKPLLKQVPDWVEGARHTLAGAEPDIEMGKHCHDPFGCPFLEHCGKAAPKVDLPLTLLPNAGRTVPGLEVKGYKSLRDIPAGTLRSEQHERVRAAHVSGKAYFDPAVSKLMRAYPYPRSFLDFETIAFAIPRWPGTRPYQQVPFQWSVHVESPRGSTRHHEFLDLSGNLPAEDLAGALIAALPDDGPVFAYSAQFESARLAELGELLPKRKRALTRLRERIVDLLPITRNHYYHPEMQGSWSIKNVLPTIPGAARYDDLDEVRDGGAAQTAYLEAVAPETTGKRRKEIEQSLRQYCALDTEALLTLSRFLQGRGSK